MKLLLIAALFTLSLANSFFLRAPGLTPISDAGSAPTCIGGFFTAFFAHFDLPQPTKMLACFCKDTAELYFKHLYEVTDLVQNAEARNKLEVHLDILKLLLIDKGLEDVYQCVARTEEFQDLQNALNITDRSAEMFGLSKFIYYQANFGKLAGELPEVIGALNNNNFTNAGGLAASLVSNVVNEINSQGLALLALNGLWNGVHIGLDLPDAQSVFSCWNNDTATTRLEFIYGLANAVANGEWKDAVTNSKNWYQQTGNALLAKIPESAWQCWANSTDTQSESDKLKIDITSMQFYERVAEFTQDHQAAYWGLQKVIKASMEQHNFLHAGSTYGHLLQLAAL